MSNLTNNVTDLVEFLKHIEEAQEQEGGELTPEKEALLNAKIKAIARDADKAKRMLGLVSSMSDKLAEEYKALRDTANSLDKLHDRIWDEVKAAMHTLNTDELLGEYYRFKLVRAKPSLVIDEKFLSDEWKKTEIVVTADRPKIREALEKGEKVAGACLEPSFSLRDYVNSKVKGK